MEETAFLLDDALRIFKKSKVWLFGAEMAAIWMFSNAKTGKRYVAAWRVGDTYTNTGIR